jgi:hypothetical protein
MAKYNRSKPSSFAYPLISFLILTLLVYVLRGLAILTFIPGGVILVLIILTILTAILYWIERNQRF